MKINKLVSYLAVVFLISTVGISAGYANTITTQASEDLTIAMEPLTPITRDIKPVVRSNEYYMLPTDTQITYAPEDETHLSSAIDGQGNPFIVYDKVYDFSTSNLVNQLSSNKGAEWPEDLIIEWNFEDSYAINPDISILSDGMYAFGTYETGWQEPQVNMLQYPDVNNYETWEITYFDRSDRSSYVAETSATTNGENTLAVACITDYDSGEAYMTDTIVINWNCYRGEESWPGVIFYNTNSEDISEPLSHLTSAAGDKIFFIAEQEKADGSKTIKSYYCEVDETTEYSDWRSGSVAGGQGDCTYPNVDVSGNLAYCVYMDNRNGNEDIYVATTTSGGFWMKYVVADSEDDEMYPVVTANGNEATCMFVKNNDLYVTKSEDAGKTWSDPMKVNDDSDSVVAEFGSLDISGAYGFWASNREGNNDLFFEEVGQFAEVVIDSVTGGFGAKATISNVGNADSEDVDWSIAIDGGLVFAGSETSGTISVPAGSTVTVNTGFIFALGEVTITTTVGSEIKTASGFALGPFILNVA